MGITEATDENFNQEISGNEKVVVKYYADWCGSCRLFHPKFKRLSNDERFEGVQFLNVNAENNETARKLAGVANLPSFAIFKNGELVETIASSKEETVIELIDKIK
ncbi:MAG: thioredoxin family protein [Reichenbachiella sp.]